MDSRLLRREKERLARKEEIIGAAEKLFLEKGFDNTSIEDIARESGFTIRTLYQYFVNKEDLLYSVEIREIVKFHSIVDAAKSKGNTAFEKIQLSNKAFYQFYKDYPGMYHLMNFRPSDKQSRKELPHYKEFMQLQGTIFQKYTDLVEEGKLDGSIRQDIDAKKAAHFGIIASMNFLGSMSNASREYWEGYKLDKDDFILFGFDMISEALRAGRR